MKLTLEFLGAGRRSLGQRGIGALVTACLLALSFVPGIAQPSTVHPNTAQPASAVPVETVSSRLSWRSPVGEPLEVVRGFEKPAQKWSPGHRGVDLAVHSDEVLAPADGKVVFAGKVVDRGVITIEHPDGRKSSFEPVTDALAVGSEVSAGDVIAHLDSGIAHCSVPCIHWGVREGKDRYINPLLLLGLEKPSILLPIGDDFSA